MKRIATSLAGLVLISGLAACGSGQDAQIVGSPYENPEYYSQMNNKVWDESQVMELAGIKAKGSGYYLMAHPSCEGAVVLTSASMVNTYSSDTIATNPDRSAGIKVTSAERATCVRLFTEAMKAVV